MKVTIPEALKQDMPKTPWGKLLMATPVIMTVLATMLAGLASSEMTRAQYDRALAAQQQSKAGDQWSFFQAKRLRGAIQRNTYDLLQATTVLRGLDPAALRQAAQSTGQPEAAKAKDDLLALLDSARGQQALAFLQRGELPQIPAAAPVEPNVKAAMTAVEDSKPEPEIASLLGQISDQTLEAALRIARNQAEALDAATQSVNQTVEALDSLLGRLKAVLSEKGGTAVADGVAPGLASVFRDFTAARFRYAALRYEVEARLNQSIANLYELQVRKSNHSAERHHARSQRFFYGMLAAQMAVIVATFAMAARQRNLLWSIAAAAGLAAIALAIYVYLYV